MAKRKGSAKKHSRPGRLRIVAGKWRSRLLPIADQPGLRPTSDRVRETLFNWLSTTIHGSHCLDLFAGTGALGFEALSRGAATAVLVEKSAVTAGLLEDSARLLGAENATIRCADSLAMLAAAADRRYDIVFIDPPFDDDLVEQCCQLLHSNGWLAQGGAIYIEQHQSAPLPRLPAIWHVIRNKTAGDARFMLARAGNED